ncbi:MAG: Gfo/Idh/MocA family oxidoreductase [Erysipelotrichaceae bacterium]|nr:Gfo/Idh/MocA family oxidoreductase [Erysipelotrichaceae bacterium]
MINVGIIGSGGIVPSFLEATKAVKGYRYVGISSPHNEQRLKELYEQYGISYYSLDSEKVFTDPKIQVIYVATPNAEHYPAARRALECGKHVIVEKPFTGNYRQAKELIDLAAEKNLIIFEAITLRHKPNYLKMKELLSEIGEIKMVDINFSQYSSRYDKFKKGIVLPTFDPRHAGGSLMDLGVYSIHFVLGLFGEPKSFRYFANVTKGIDTSGTLVMDYGSFKATLVTCKDCKAPLHTCIQGDGGYLYSPQASSVLDSFEHVMNDGTKKKYRLNKDHGIGHFNEYKEFKRIFNEMDMECARYWNQETLKVQKILDAAREDAGIGYVEE